MDGAILGRWMEVGVQKRKEILGRVGQAEEDGMVVREELRGLRGVAELF